MFVVSQEQRHIGEIIDALFLVWTSSGLEERRNQIVFLPFR